MRLDYDCIRDILFTVEETTTLAKPCFINQNYREYKRLEKYDFEKLVLTCLVFAKFDFHRSHPFRRFLSRFSGGIMPS